MHINESNRWLRSSSRSKRISFSYVWMCSHTAQASQNRLGNPTDMWGRNVVVRTIWHAISNTWSQHKNSPMKHPALHARFSTVAWHFSLESCPLKPDVIHLTITMTPNLLHTPCLCRSATAIKADPIYPESLPRYNIQLNTMHYDETKVFLWRCVHY